MQSLEITLYTAGKGQRNTLEIPPAWLAVMRWSRERKYATSKRLASTRSRRGPPIE